MIMPFLISFTCINSRQIKEIKNRQIRPSIKVLGGNLHNLEVGKAFLSKTQNPPIIKEKNERFKHIKI